MKYTITYFIHYPLIPDLFAEFSSSVQIRPCRISRHCILLRESSPRINHSFTGTTFIEGEKNCTICASLVIHQGYSSLLTHFVQL